MLNQMFVRQSFIPAISPNYSWVMTFVGANIPAYSCTKAWVLLSLWGFFDANLRSL